MSLAAPAATPDAPERVLLVSMPFGALDRPAISLGLLKAHCRRLDVPCDVRYLAFAFRGSRRILQLSLALSGSGAVHGVRWRMAVRHGAVRPPAVQRCGIPRRGPAAHLARRRRRRRPG